MLTTLTRIIKSGLLSFWRNIWLSTATCGIIVLTLVVMTSILILNVITTSLLEDLENKIDISVYFKLDVKEDDILGVKSVLAELEEVKSVEYVSQEEALGKFKERHKDNPLLMQSLEELDSNPLAATLNIKAGEAAQYKAVSDFLKGPRFRGLIDKVNYRQNQEAIAKIFTFSRIVRRTGVIITLVLAFIAVLITFNTIRLAIYSAREEINIMKLVGASNWYIRGPFLVEGITHGIIAAIITLALFYPLTSYLSPKLTGFLPEADISFYFRSNIWQILVLELIVGILLGVASSLVAVRRYLRV